MKKNKIYGYMIGYREIGSRFVRYYRKYPQCKRENNHPIINPFWEIQPITKKEILAGIWDEIPFLWKYRPFLCSLSLS